MLTHYAKCRPKQEKSLNDVFGSLVYSLLPSDTLLTKPKIVETVFKYFKDHPEESRGMTQRVHDINRSVDNLVKNAFLKELHGIRLTRFIDSI